MDMGMGHAHGSGIGSDVNRALARDFWYLVAGAVGLFAAAAAVQHCGAARRLQACNEPAVKHPTRPRGRLGQAWATATAVVREVSLPQLVVRVRGLGWASPPPLGRVVVVGCYWAVVAFLMAWRAVEPDVYYWERIGYRNAWVALAQLPLVFLLAMKTSPVGWLVGSSHERLSWLHRWVARTMLVTATVHGFHFWAEWAAADFVSYQLETMPIVKYGLGAWAVLLWSVVVGFLPVRRLAYEAWVVQHVLSAAVMLWLLYRHVPVEARYLLWMSVAFAASDRLARWLLLAWCNVNWRRGPSRRLGHGVTMQAVGSATTVVTVDGVSFGWRPGQHLYLWLPRLGPLEAHPYTMACAGPVDGAVQLVVSAQSGFSRRIHAFARRHPERTLVGFVSGPYGAPPRWDAYETLVLIAASSGASFTVPMLEAAAARPTCVRRIDVVLVARTADELEFYAPRARRAARRARCAAIDVRLHIAVTGGAGPARADAGQPLLLRRGSGARAETEKPPPPPPPPPPPGAEHRAESAEPLFGPGAAACSGARDSDESSRSTEPVTEYTTRPDLEALIRGPVEQAWGETAVVVCGGRQLVAATRNCVSRLSDERAVHKGTGAQGIYLHAEEYAF